MRGGGGLTTRVVLWLCKKITPVLYQDQTVSNKNRGVKGARRPLFAKYNYTLFVLYQAQTERQTRRMKRDSYTRASSLSMNKYTLYSIRVKLHNNENGPENQTAVPSSVYLIKYTLCSIKLNLQVKTTEAGGHIYAVLSRCIIETTPCTLYYNQVLKL